MPDIFERRLARAQFLEQEWPYAAAVLRFFSLLTRIQRTIFLTKDSRPEIESALLEAVREHGPALLAERARSMSPDDLRLLQDRHAAGERLEDPVEEFFLRVVRQPLEMSRPPTPSEGSAACPACGLPPLLGVLREDKAAETVRRTLVCPLCSQEWDFPRVLCPGCREERPEKLPRYTAQEIPWIRVEACDSCRKYLKAVDLAKNPDADPVVDEIASTPLDALARERGYIKIAPNLLGI